MANALHPYNQALQINTSIESSMAYVYTMAKMLSKLVLYMQNIFLFSLKTTSLEQFWKLLKQVKMI